VRPDAGDREERQRDPPVQGVDRHRPREDEAADEHEDDRVGEGREDGPHVPHAECDAEHRAEEGGDRQRDGFAHPEHRDRRENRRESHAFGLDGVCNGDERPGECEGERREEDAGELPPALEAGLGLGDQLALPGKFLDVVLVHVRIGSGRGQDGHEHLGEMLNAE
jgi:hypothetical protein